MARITRYLPKNSKVVIQSGDAPAVWYTTRKEIECPEHPTTTTCPITEAAVYTLVEAGIRVFYLGKMTRPKVVLEDGDVDEAAYNEQFCLFVYDVPHGGPMENPSPYLYPIAVRMSESAWLMRLGDVPYDLMARMQDEGCAVDVNRFDREESRRLILQSIGTMQRELAAVVAGAQQSLEDATDALAAAADDATVTEEQAQKKFEARIKAVEKRLALRAANAEKAAARFGIRPQAVNLHRLADTSRSIRAEMAERAAAYRVARQALAAAGTVDATAAANLAATSQMPVAPMADMLREAGQEGAADRLQAAFAETPVEDDGVFSLADMADAELEATDAE